MDTLWNEIVENLAFLVAAVCITAGIALTARLLERLLPNRHSVSSAHRVSIVGICSAISLVLYLLDFPLLFLAPEFYKVDFSEVPVLLCGFFLGPSATVACEAIKILLKLLFKGTTTAFVGDFANFVVGCTLVLPATLIYHFHKSRTSAIVGLATGTVFMTIFGSCFNAIYLLPKFAQVYGIPLDSIIAMGTRVHSSIHSVSGLVLLCVAPLNLVKGAAVSVLTLLLYKKVATPLFSRLP